MKPVTKNILIDSMAFVSGLMLLATGAILRFVLPPGSGGLGQGRRSREAVTLWGWNRHEWGDIHFWIAVVLLVILLIHLVLHWRWIVHVFLPGRKNKRS